MRRKLKDYRQVSLAVEELDGKIDFAQVFGRTGPVHIEVGAGKGTFLLNEARANPQVDFLGIEWAGRYYRYAVDRIGRWAVRNVRMVRTDAAGFLAGYVGDNSVDCFHIYFPDPWPKKRHRKRRFFNRANVEHLVRILKPGGQIRIATDHAEYFEQIEQVISAEGNRLEKVEFLPAAGAEKDEWVGTNFERKYLKEQRAIYTTAVMKR